MSTILHTYMHARTQPERRERSRTALLGAAARGISRNGYANLNLEQVARDAGYTRGALYHQFKDKDDLVLAVLEWVDQSWQAEVAPAVAAASSPADALLAMARGHAVFCRRGVARFEIALRLEFSDRDHPVAQALDRVSAGLVRRCSRLVDAGRNDGSIPPGPPAPVVARALIGAIEGTVVALA